MKRTRLLLACLFLGFSILSCSLFTSLSKPEIGNTPAVELTPGTATQAIAKQTASIPETTTPRPTEPSATATIPPSATSTLMISSTPGTPNKLAGQETAAAATEAESMKGFSTTLLSQCPNPSDPPVQNWLNIPVMPQATAGQVVKTLIGSYYCFEAPVTVTEMEAFYKQNLTAPDWILQSDTNGSMVFVGFGKSGVQSLFLVSGPGNKNDLIVALNVTNPIKLPTSKP